MPAKQTTVALNAFGLERRDRTTDLGTSSRYTVSVSADPFVATFNAKDLGAAPAQAIAAHYRARIAGIGAKASVRTLEQREIAKKALAAGKPWATKRYAGGRTGAKSPGDSERLFNDSGRFAEGVVATPTRDNAWTINVTANRLDPSTFRDGEAGVQRLFVQLREYVPEFGDANITATMPAIREAISDSVQAIFQGGLGAFRAGRDLSDAIRKSKEAAAVGAADLLRSLAG